MDGLGNDRVYTTLEDKSRTLWFSTPGDGESRYDGDVESRDDGKCFTAFPGPLTRTHVQSTLQDRDGNLWFGVSGGLFRFDGTSFINVSKNGSWR
jgi:ligand-binding sensor domain-containing protein